MREITHGDIRAAARALLARPEEFWPALMARMLDDAHHADCHRKALGRLHERLGNGTLMDVALKLRTVPEPLPSDTRYLCALATVIEAVLDWRANRPAQAVPMRRASSA